MLTRPISISRQTFALVKIVIGFFNANIQEAVTIRAVKGRDDGLAIDSHRAAREDFLFLLLPYRKKKRRKVFFGERGDDIGCWRGDCFAAVMFSSLGRSRVCREKTKDQSLTFSTAHFPIGAFCERKRERERERERHPERW